MGQENDFESRDYSSRLWLRKIHVYVEFIVASNGCKERTHVRSQHKFNEILQRTDKFFLKLVFCYFSISWIVGYIYFFSFKPDIEPDSYW